MTDSDAIAREIDREYLTLPSPGLSANLAEYFMFLFMFLFIQPRLYWLPAKIPFLGLGESVFDPSFPVDKLSGVKAGFLRGWRQQLETSNSTRMENSGFYMKRFLGGAPYSFPVPYLRYPVLVGDKVRREALFLSSEEKGLGLSRMYPSPVNEIPEIRDRFNGASFPSAKRVADRILTLPTHGFVTPKDREEIGRLFGPQTSHA